MCETSAFDDRLRLVGSAIEAADDLLKGFAPVQKRLDLSNPRGFDRAVAVLASELRRAVGTSDVNAVREAVAVLDVDWASTSPTERSKLVSRALVAAKRATAIIPDRIQAPLGERSEEVVQAARSDARRRGLATAGDLNSLDRRIARHIVKSQVHFVRDEYGRRVDDFGNVAKGVVARGLEAGLGRSDIAQDLERAAQHSLIKRAPYYWEIIAASFVGHGRSFAQMSSYAEAGIERYRLESVLDENTTDTCRFLHGQTFSVGRALQRFDALERLDQPEDVKLAMPWVRERIQRESGLPELYVNTEKGQVRLAEVTRSALGTKDDRGEFRGGISGERLEDLGVGFPPFHGLCRTATISIT